MSEHTAFEGASSEFLVHAVEEIKKFEEYFDQHTAIIATAILFPSLVEKEDLLVGYRELLSTFRATISAGQMAAEAELITRDLSNIDPNI